MTNDGKFVLDGKRVEFSDYGGSSKVGADDRLDTMDANLDHLMLANVRNVVPRLDNIEAEIRVLQYSAGKMNEWLSRAEHRVNELQEKIDGID
jgi:hypothetical protein